MKKKTKPKNRTYKKSPKRFTTFLVTTILLVTLVAGSLFTYNYATSTVFAKPSNDNSAIIAELQEKNEQLFSDYEELFEENNALNNLLKFTISEFQEKLTIKENALFDLEEELEALLSENFLNIDLIEQLNIEISELRDDIFELTYEFEAEVYRLQSIIIDLNTEIESIIGDNINYDDLLDYYTKDTYFYNFILNGELIETKKTSLNEYGYIIDGWYELLFEEIGLGVVSFVNNDNDSNDYLNIYLDEYLFDYMDLSIVYYDKFGNHIETVKLYYNGSFLIPSDASIIDCVLNLDYIFPRVEVSYMDSYNRSFLVHADSISFGYFNFENTFNYDKGSFEISSMYLFGELMYEITVVHDEGTTLLEYFGNGDILDLSGFNNITGIYVDVDTSSMNKLTFLFNGYVEEYSYETIVGLDYFNEHLDEFGEVVVGYYYDYDGTGHQVSYMYIERWNEYEITLVHDEGTTLLEYFGNYDYLRLEIYNNISQIIISIINE